MLAAVLHVQHNECHVRQIGHGLPAGSDSVYPDDMARVHEQFRESGDLHHLQPGVSEGVQEDHAHGQLAEGSGGCRSNERRIAHMLM